MKNILSLFLVFFLSSVSVFATDGEKNIFIFVKDKAGNIQTQAASGSIILDTTVPVVNIINNVDATPTNTPKIITANVTDLNLLTSQYALVWSWVSCNSVSFTTNYISWSDLVFANESFNGRKVCFKAVDRAGNQTIASSNVIENIDTIVPSAPAYNYSYQNGYNSITFKGTCTYEPGLKFIVKDNGTIIHEESLSNPCVIDFTYTLSSPPLVHNIEYYLQDPAGNKTSTKSFNAYVDNVWYLITPADWVTVTPIISFMWFTATPNASIKIKQIWGDYIAQWTADAKWYFVIQTPTSQPLGSLQIDLEINWTLRGDVRNLTVASSSIVVPTFSNEDDIVRSNTKLITAEIKWQPLSKVKMYSKDGAWNRIELWETSLDASGNGTIPSSVQLPGGENILYVQDTIYNVSSQILLIVVVDPFWYVYDSITKEKIPGAKIFVTDCNGNNIALPNVNGKPQTNPVIADSTWYYDSYELPGTYCIKVEKDWYKWPSVIVATWSLNLNGSANIWSHGQPFVVVNDPIHIDIPMDKIAVASWGWGWGWSTLNSYDFRYSTASGTTSTTLAGRKMEIKYPSGLKTLTKTYNIWLESLFIDSLGYYRFMYHKGEDIKEIPFNQSVLVSITDLDYVGQEILYKTSDDQEWKMLTPKNINGKTFSFSIDKGFILKLSKDLPKVESITEAEVVVITEGIKKYPTKKHDISIVTYVKHSKGFAAIGKMDNQKVLERFPKIFEKVDLLLKNKKLSQKNKDYLKALNNYMVDIYEVRYSQYISQKIITKK